MKIDLNKKYRTKLGYKVELFAIRSVHAIGAYYTGENDKQVNPAYWGMSGEFFKNIELCPDLNLVEVALYDDFKIDDKVLVSNDGVDWVKRHFAGTDLEGIALAFDLGATSFTSNSITSWEYCKKYVEDEEN